MDELRKADIILLPGTKNTLSDLSELRRNGVAQAIVRTHRNGTTVMGICGGYQMMGLEVCDPDHVEGDIERLPGLGLLPIMTRLTKEKTTRQVVFRLDVASLPLGEDGVEGQRGLARPAQSRENDQGIPGQVQGDVFQVVDAGTSHEDSALGGSNIHGHTCYAAAPTNPRFTNGMGGEGPFEPVGPTHEPR